LRRWLLPYSFINPYMIVKQNDTGWLIINQPAHGLLAFNLALQWSESKRPDFWPETLIALTEHDDGQPAWDGRNHLTAAGTPLDFKILVYSAEQCRNLIGVALQKSRWNALMASMHTTFLYEEKRGTDKELDEFLDQQADNQEKWRKQYKATKKAAQYAYDFVQWCDALSLILCQQLVPINGRRLEISAGPDGVPYYIAQRDDDTLTVDPWPFLTDEFTVHVEAFAVAQVVFTSDDELYRAIQDASLQRCEWTFKR